jgi:FKBP-type peptidyl-prolyl cis-trans isomerase
MPRRKGVRIEDIRLGTGALAQQGQRARIACQIALNRGDVVRELEYSFLLGAREVIAGLEYGLEGMRVGGIRRLRIGPHLAYGDAGLAEAGIPGHAVLVVTIELLEVGDPNDD